MARIVTANLMLVVRPDFPATTVRELIDYAKKNPGKLNYGTVGAGGVNHLAHGVVQHAERARDAAGALQGAGATGCRTS